MFWGMLALLSANIRAILLAASGAAAMFALCWVYDALIDDPRVAREARREYVKISELEAAKAKADTAEQLLAAATAKAAAMETARIAYDAALANAQALIDAANENNEALQNEIEDLESATPTGVPSVRDLGVKLRN